MDADIENEINKIRWERWRAKQKAEREKTCFYCWDQWNQWNNWNNWSDVPTPWEQTSDKPCVNCWERSGEAYGVAHERHYFDDPDTGESLNIYASGVLAYYAKARGSAWYDFDLTDSPDVRVGDPGDADVKFSDIVGELNSMNVAGVDGMSIHMYVFVDDLTTDERIGEEIVISEALSDTDSILGIVDYVVEVLLPEWTHKEYDLHSVTYHVYIPNMKKHKYRVGYWAEVVAIGAGGTACVSDFEGGNRRIKTSRFRIGQLFE